MLLFCFGCLLCKTFDENLKSKTKKKLGLLLPFYTFSAKKCSLLIGRWLEIFTFKSQILKFDWPTGFTWGFLCSYGPATCSFELPTSQILVSHWLSFYFWFPSLQFYGFHDWPRFYLGSQIRIIGFLFCFLDSFQILDHPTHWF